MSIPEGPTGEQKGRKVITHWQAILFWTVGVFLAHYAFPWGLSLLTMRIGWVAGRPGWANLLCLLLVIAGTVGVIWTMAQHYVQAPQGWDLERVPKYLLSRGPYQWTRNPMYISELAIWLGWALFYGSLAVLIGFLAFGAFMNFLAVPMEERDLEARFGEAYRQYKRQVPRWFGKTGG